MQDMTLVILAAGMGSRFGGLKQIEPIGPNGEFLIDYSIYDAIKAGFNKIVFIIKPENLEIFKETIGKRIEDQIQVEYALQDIDQMKKLYNIPKDRIKPLGTTQAILSAKEFVHEPFVIINADDFYGYEAYQDAVNFFKSTNYQKYGNILYKVANTLTENGKVKRGICQVENGKLVKATESSVEKVDGQIVATPLNEEQSFIVADDTPTSMNMLALLPDIFPLLENLFAEFMKENADNLDNCEALILEDLFKLIQKGEIELYTVLTSAVWFGVTYKEDKAQVVSSIQKLIEQKVYPLNLWPKKN